jgi:RimJ/RimL family protein N-acetyltransferase
MLTRRWRTPQQTRCAATFHVLRTASLILRTPTQREAQIAAAGASDDEAQRWLGWEKNLIWPEPHRTKLLSLHADGGERPSQPATAASWELVAIDPDNLAIAGFAGFQPPMGGLCNLVGGWLTPGYRGRGLGCELFAAALALGHQHLGIEVIHAGAEETNAASRKSLEAAGFRQVPGAPTHTLPNGRGVPACWYEHVALPSTCHRRSRP